MITAAEMKEVTEERQRIKERTIHKKDIEGLSLEEVEQELKRVLRDGHNFGFIILPNKISEEAVDELKKSGYRIFVQCCKPDVCHPYRTIASTFIFWKTGEDFLKEHNLEEPEMKEL